MRREFTAILYDAIFLDFDGVIVESLAVKIQAFRTLYAPYGLEVENKAVAYYVGHAGIPRGFRIRECHRAFLGRELLDAEVQELAARFGDLVEDGVVACDWVPGARAFLDRYHRALPLFVVSATPNEELQRIVERRGIADPFASIHGSPPDKTTTIAKLIEDHGLNASRLLMVGDGFADYRAATDNKIAFVGRLHDGYPSPFPDGTETINDLRPLPQLIESGPGKP